MFSSESEDVFVSKFSFRFFSKKRLMRSRCSTSPQAYTLLTAYRQTSIQKRFAEAKRRMGQRLSVNWTPTKWKMLENVGSIAQTLCSSSRMYVYASYD